jgi:hypothetical protein
MAYKHNIIKERFDLKITDPNQVFKGTYELDKNANIILGLVITSDRDDLLFYRGSQKIQINDQELFPEEFESRLLMSGINVSPDDRMVSVGCIEAGNGRVEVWYKDSNHPTTRFVPYRVTFYVFSKVELNDERR